MQLSLSFVAPTPLAVLDQRLRNAYAVPEDFYFPDPVSQLALAILGSKTLDAVAMAAFEAVRAAFPEWDALCDASPAAVQLLLQGVTFAEAKSVQLPAALRKIRDRRGEVDLDFLDTWPVEPARLWLMELPGVGPKVSAAVLNFSRLRKRALVIDTHYLRVVRRLGLIGTGVGDDRAYRVLERLLPDAWGAEAIGDHHWRVKTHGQTRCRAIVPQCVGCPLDDVCQTAPLRDTRHEKTAGASPWRRAGLR